MTPGAAMYVLWTAWAVSWLAAALWSDPAARRPGFSTELLYRAVTIAGAVMLFAPARYNSHMGVPDWRVDVNLSWLLVAAALTGFMFCWWARIHLGRLWSGWVTRKADHHIVDTGPYAIVRHPIYTGIILAAFATAILEGRAVALVGAALMTAGFWIKARLEERFLRQELGVDAYDSYRRRVPMLVPFGHKAA